MLEVVWNEIQHLSLLNDCIYLLSKFLQTRVVHVFKEGNRCTDALGRMGSNMAEEFLVFDNPPSPNVLYFVNLNAAAVLYDKTSNSVLTDRLKDEEACRISAIKTLTIADKRIKDLNIKLTELVDVGTLKATSRPSKKPGNENIKAKEKEPNKEKSPEHSKPPPIAKEASKEKEAANDKVFEPSSQLATKVGPPPPANR
nr:hypothetical protein CFP56_61192 [Quercus suber]